MLKRLSVFMTKLVKQFRAIIPNFLIVMTFKCQMYMQYSIHLRKLDKKGRHKGLLFFENGNGLHNDLRRYL